MDFFTTYPFLILQQVKYANLLLEIKGISSRPKNENKSSQFFFCYGDMLIFNKIKNILVFLSH